MSTSESTVLWGLIGGLSFLVLAQGYVLVTGESIAFSLLFGIAILVTVCSAVGVSVTSRWLPVDP